jgi:putative salt-induced outer membrane protein YdiY
MANLSWAVTVQVDGRVAMSASTAATPVEATESLQVAIAPGDTDKVVDLMPGAGESLHVLVIKSSFYGDDELSFKASDGATDSDPVTLSSPQAYTSGSAALFGLDPNQLKFTNTSTTETANVAIFVARDATP